jgi:hypothetical protein
MRNPRIGGTIDEMKALITTLSQILGPGTIDQSNAQGIVGSVAICQSNAHITTLSDIVGSVITGKTIYISQPYQIL